MKVMEKETAFLLILKVHHLQSDMDVKLDILQMDTDNVYLNKLSLNVLKDSIKINKEFVFCLQLHAHMVIDLMEMENVYQLILKLYVLKVI